MDTVAEQFETTGVDMDALDATRAAVEDAEPMLTTGALSGLVSGLCSIAALAGGIILGI